MRYIETILSIHILECICLCLCESDNFAPPCPPCFMYANEEDGLAYHTDNKDFLDSFELRL